jgi:hypothetical protein
MHRYANERSTLGKFLLSDLLDMNHILATYCLPQVCEYQGFTGPQCHEKKKKPICAPNGAMGVFALEPCGKKRQHPHETSCERLWFSLP